MIRFEVAKRLASQPGEAGREEEGGEEMSQDEERQASPVEQGRAGINDFAAAWRKCRQAVQTHRSKYFTWSQISRFSKTWIVRSSPFWMVVVPLAAQLSMKIKETVAVNVFGHEWHLVMELPFSWKLFFFGSLAATCAVLINAIRCPEIIREHEDFRSFREAGKGADQLRYSIIDPLSIGFSGTEWTTVAIHLIESWSRQNRSLTLAEAQGAVGEIWEKMVGMTETGKLTMTVDEFEELVLHLQRTLSDMENSNPEVERAYWAVRRALETSFPLWRLTASLLIAAASVAYGIVVAQNAWTVLWFVAG